MVKTVDLEIDRPVLILLGRYRNRNDAPNLRNGVQCLGKPDALWQEPLRWYFKNLGESAQDSLWYNICLFSHFEGFVFDAFNL